MTQTTPQPLGLINIVRLIQADPKALAFHFSPYDASFRANNIEGVWVLSGTPVALADEVILEAYCGYCAEGVEPFEAVIRAGGTLIEGQGPILSNDGAVRARISHKQEQLKARKAARDGKSAAELARIDAAERLTRIEHDLKYSSFGLRDDKWVIHGFPHEMRDELHSLVDSYCKARGEGLEPEGASLRAGFSRLFDPKCLEAYQVVQERINSFKSVRPKITVRISSDERASGKTALGVLLGRSLQKQGHKVDYASRELAHGAKSETKAGLTDLFDVEIVEDGPANLVYDTDGLHPINGMTLVGDEFRVSREVGMELLHLRKEKKAAEETMLLALDITGDGLVTAGVWHEAPSDPNAEVEISVRRHTTYGVHRYRFGKDAIAGDPRGGKSDTLAEGLSLAAANELATAMGKALPKATVTTLVTDKRVSPTRGHEGWHWIENAAFEALTRAGGVGASLAIQMHASGDRVLVETLEPRVSAPLEPRSEWLSTTSMAEIEKMGAALRAMPYEMVAAMKRNAIKAGDDETLHLLRSFQIAEDVT